jgi:hypothetical protein
LKSGAAAPIGRVTGLKSSALQQVVAARRRLSNACFMEVLLMMRRKGASGREGKSEHLPVEDHPKSEGLATLSLSPECGFACVIFDSSLHPP